MFEEIMGIPMHPLLVHAAVVFVPLLALLAIAYAVLPVVRSHTRWVLAGLAVVTPFTAWFARLSGTAFYARMKARDEVSGEFIPKLDEHGNFGNLTQWVTLALGVVALVLVFLVRPRGVTGGPGANLATHKAVPVVLAVLTAAISVAALYYVVRTGDSGAKAVWEGR